MYVYTVVLLYFWVQWTDLTVQYAQTQKYEGWHIRKAFETCAQSSVLSGYIIRSKCPVFAAPIKRQIPNKCFFPPSIGIDRRKCFRSEGPRPATKTFSCWSKHPRFVLDKGEKIDLKMGENIRRQFIPILFVCFFFSVDLGVLKGSDI